MPPVTTARSVRQIWECRAIRRVIHIHANEHGYDRLERLTPNRFPERSFHLPRRSLRSVVHSIRDHKHNRVRREVAGRKFLSVIGRRGNRVLRRIVERSRSTRPERSTVISKMTILE